MIEIEASNIYFGGGYTLLEEMLHRLEKKEIPSRVYVSYSAIYEAIISKNLKFSSVVKTNTVKTILRYCRKRTKVLFFCSLPPFRKNSRSIVYSHNLHILNRPNIKKTKFFLYYYWNKFFKNKVDLYACQTNAISDKLARNNFNVEILPFYTQMKKTNSYVKFDFAYISTAAPHKNHTKLLEAIEVCVHKGLRFTIVLTLRESDSNAELLNKISSINQLVPNPIIINAGFVSKNRIEEILSSTRYLIFPSLKETLGLPIVEAIQCGTKVLSSELPFSYDLISNPITFNPFDIDSISSVMIKALENKYDQVHQEVLIKDSFDTLINKLTPHD